MGIVRSCDSRVSGLTWADISERLKTGKETTRTGASVAQVACPKPMRPEQMQIAFVPGQGTLSLLMRNATNVAGTSRSRGR
jgi:hypothetical protein